MVAERLARGRQGALEDVAGALVHQTLERVAVGEAGDLEQQRAHDAAHEPSDRGAGVLQGTAELPDDLGVVVDEGQGVVDDVNDVIQIDQEQRAGADVLDGEARCRP